jgi:hypothetical protein
MARDEEHVTLHLQSDTFRLQREIERLKKIGDDIISEKLV